MRLVSNGRLEKGENFFMKNNLELWNYEETFNILGDKLFIIFSIVVAKLPVIELLELFASL